MWSRISPALIALRDLAAFGLGGWGVIHEALKDQPQVLVLTFFGVLMIAPGALAFHWLATSGIGASSSPPPQSPVSPPSAPPSVPPSSSGSG